MRSVIAAAVLACAAPGSAQPLPTAPVPDWRVSTSLGLTGSAFHSIVAASAERPAYGPLQAGGRVWATLGSGFVDDGPTMEGGGAEAFAAVGTRDRWLDVRATAGLGLAYLDYSASGLVHYDPDLGFVQTGTSFKGVRPYAHVGLGVDLYPVRPVGVGLEVRLAAGAGEADVSAMEVGLRVRLGG